MCEPNNNSNNITIVERNSQKAAGTLKCLKTLIRHLKALISLFQHTEHTSDEGLDHSGGVNQSIRHYSVLSLEPSSGGNVHFPLIKFVCVILKVYH